MKVYRDNHSLRLVGKGWEVKAKLREFAKSNLLLIDYLKLYKR